METLRKIVPHYDDFERVNTLRWRIINAPQEVCIERARYLTQSMMHHWEKPALTRMSLALEHILNNISVIIRDDELIVGCRTSKLKGAPLFPENSRAGLKAIVIILISAYYRKH